MSDEAYEQRQGTVRQYIKQQKAIHGPNWKPPKMNPALTHWKGKRIDNVNDM